VSPVLANRSVLERVLAAYRERDLDECIRSVRTLVEAAPLATAPRQLLASLYVETHQSRLALVH
jgi:tRNA A-37 threonylcarbamoyl transferase component Bud32